MSSKLDFKVHIEKLIAKGNRMSGFVQRTFKARNKEFMRTMLKSLIVPQLEYGSVVWTPMNQSQVEDIESVQRRFTARISCYNQPGGRGAFRCSHTYAERIKDMKMYSLQRRRERYLILHLYKIAVNYLPKCGLVHRQTRTGTFFEPKFISDNNVPMWIRRAKEVSFFNQAPRLFNWLPKELKQIPTLDNPTKKDINTYKAKLDKFLSTIIDDPDQGARNSLLNY
jgi:hypothetical protein